MSSKAAIILAWAILGSAAIAGEVTLVVTGHGEIALIAALWLYILAPL